jgi:hypothetical protein
VIEQHSACPFCGRSRISLYDRSWTAKFDRQFYTQCNTCDMQGPSARSEREAWFLWEERALPLNDAHMLLLKMQEIAAMIGAQP